MVAAHEQLWPDASLGGFLHACAAVRTRGFFDAAAGGGGPYMLPAIDMLNHARDGTATSLSVERIDGTHDGAAGGMEHRRHLSGAHLRRCNLSLARKGVPIAALQHHAMKAAEWRGEAAHVEQLTESGAVPRPMP